MSNYWKYGAGRGGPLLLAALLGAAAALPQRAQAQTLYNGAGGIVAVTDSLLYVRGDGTGQGFENVGEFNQTGIPAGQKSRLFVDEGNLINTGLWVAGSGTVVMNGASGTQRTLGPGGATFNNLRIDNPAGSGTGGVILSSSGQVSNTLRMANGFLNTTTTPNRQIRLTATGRVVGENNLSYVKGSLIQQLPVSGGSAVDFGGMGFTVNPQGQAFTLEVDRRAGQSTLNYSYGQNPTTPGFQGIDRIWRLTGSTSILTTQATLTLSWLSADDRGNNFASSQAQVWYSIDGGTTWKLIGPPQNGSGRTVTVSTPLLTAWYTVSTLVNPLPVQLNAFTATAQNLDVNLAWSTASEVNSNYFVVQRSLNGQTWTDVRQQPAAGNSSRPRNYTEVDPGAGRLGALLYYRLHQVDTNGSGTYSPVRTVQFAPAVLGFALDAFPVPLQSWLTLDVRLPGTEPLQVELYDVAGRLIMRRAWDTPATGRYQLDVSSLASGTYLLRARQGNAQASRRLTKD